MTKRQRQVLDCIHKFVQENGHSPSYDELCVVLESKSKSSVHAIVRRLREDGWLYGIEGRARSMYPSELALKLWA